MKYEYLCFLVTSLSISSAAPSLDSNSRDHRRIIGGDEADIEKFRYMGAILFKGRQYCGAALIRSDSVVTNAVCVYGLNITDLSVRLGSSRWRSGGKELLVKQVTIHERYSIFSFDYDIAIVKLNESVNVANAVPIPLAAPDSQFSPGTPGVVSGWGKISSDPESNSETLRKVEVPVYDRTECEHAYFEGTVTHRMICAGSKEAGKNVCPSDSGGPYVIDGKLVGIVLFGTCFHSPAKPVVNVFVPAFYDWINDHA